MASGPTGPGLRAFHLLHDAVVACQQSGTAPSGDPAPLVLTAWSAVHGLATLWVDRALPFEGMDPGLLAPEIGRMVARMFAALAREEGPEVGLAVHLSNVRGGDELTAALDKI
jgi:hypothetical protein